MSKLDKAKTWVKDKVDDAKWHARNKAYEAKQWVKEHPDQTVTVICTVVGAAGVIVKWIAKGVRIQKETQLKDRYIYDRSLGAYWYLRRKPKQSEYLKIEAMRKSGMGYGEILTRLKLL